MGIKTVYIVLLVSWLLAQPGNSYGQTAMINFTGRDKIMLNGNWQVMVDPFGSGDAKQVWKERKPVVATDFVEYSLTVDLYLKCPVILIHSLLS